MTTNSVSKFSLTIIAALVLAACGSSGSSKPTTNSTNTTPSVPAPKPEQKPAPTTDARNENHQDLSAALTADTAFTGAKHVVLKESDLITNQNPGEVSSKSDKPEVLQVQKPHRSLDTIVVAETRDGNGKLIPDAPSFYLEDFDFRTDATAATAAATAGEKTLTHIYVSQDTTGGTARTATDTKTATEGTANGKVFVYQTGRANYLPGFNGTVVNKDGSALTGPATTNQPRDLNKTVAEVYGYRTFAEGANSSAAQTDIKDVNQANAPFLPENHTQLKNVQYGRVTTQLSKQNIGTLKDGLPVGSLKTKVVGYGEYGVNGTEDHYFYRGIDPTTADQLAKLKAAGSKKLSYAGHALTYGNIKPVPSASNIPTAIGVSGQLIEGTRVQATVDLDTNKVAGSLYNTWYIDKNARNIDVVTFEGTVGKSGSMYGTSTNKTDNDSKGMFAATLYNENATEMGGVVASDLHDEKHQWGAVFGAALTTAPATQHIGAAGNHEVTGK